MATQFIHVINPQNSKRKSMRGILYVHGDGLRVVDNDTKGLIVDQTIEKVSFCAPDRNYERGFSYICRDGTTRRWMCHGFMATKDTGERLSHAVGCAFAICLEKKQQRDKASNSTTNNVSMAFDKESSSFTRYGSFSRQPSVMERLQDPQACVVLNYNAVDDSIKLIDVNLFRFRFRDLPKSVLQLRRSRILSPLPVLTPQILTC